MDAANFREQVRKVEDNIDYLAKAVAKYPLLVTDLLDSVNSDNSKLKYKSIKILRTVSAKYPETLYPHFDVFVDLLNDRNNILKWNAIDILANLTGVDSDDKFGPLFKRFYNLLEEGSLITAGHVVENSPTIVNNRPTREPEITRALLDVERIPLPTEECRNILRGKVILAFNQYASLSGNKDEMVKFAQKQTNNTRAATKTKAEQFVKKFSSPTK